MAFPGPKGRTGCSTERPNGSLQTHYSHISAELPAPCQPWARGGLPVLVGTKLAGRSFRRASLGQRPHTPDSYFLNVGNQQALWLLLRLCHLSRGRCLLGIRLWHGLGLRAGQPGAGLVGPGKSKSEAPTLLPGGPLLGPEPSPPGSPAASPALRAAVGTFSGLPTVPTAELWGCHLSPGLR